MADAQPIAARCCVECGTQFQPRSSRGRPRQRCYECSRNPSRSEASIAKAKARAKRRWEEFGDALREKARVRALAKARAQGVLPRAERHALRYPSPTTKRDHTCAGCGEAFRPKKSDRTTYCSRSCAFKHRPVTEAQRAAASARRKKWPASFVWCADCKHCGVSFAARFRAAYCERHREADVRRREEIASRPAISGNCKECDRSFIRPAFGGLSAQFCSPPCGKRHVKRVTRTARKALERAARVEPVNPFEVFARDRWRCQICGIQTPKRLRGTFGPTAPELDHIIPLSKGGEHSYRNN